MMKRTLQEFRVVVAAAAVVVCAGCSKKSEEPPAPAPAAPPAAAPPQVVAAAASSGPAPEAVPAWGAATRAAGITGTLTIEPNPVVVCDKGVGVATISWNATGLKTAEIHLSAPDGALFAKSAANGRLKTGQWVGKGTVFFLQDGSEGVPRDLDHTLARLEVENVVTGPNCK